MRVPQWQEIELGLKSENSYSSPYTEVQVWMEFVHSSGRRIRRPAFWDGGKSWKVRFVSPFDTGTWDWESYSSHQDDGLAGIHGQLICGSNPSKNRFAKHGLLKMSPGMRSVVQSDGRPFLMVADTAWAIPFRATVEDCQIYAKDRHAKGFNSVLMMTVQPDKRATGPDERNVYEGFKRGFEDLPEGHINKLNPEYFQYLDQLTKVLIDHEIVPVYQPVFHGFGWKGKGVAGPGLPPEEYARYCRYLVARFGARPAIWLIGGDGLGNVPSLPSAGEEIEKWDAYAQPTGIHYAPHGNNRAHQAESWLDFQWCQTGHSGDHRQDKVAEMCRDLPIKGVANGEPTYEHMGHWDKATGWWQGHEAWKNLLSGGAMGVAYGAGSLWQWRIDKNEPGFADWTVAEGCGWREALDFEGSAYVGILGKILGDCPLTDMEKRDDYSYGNLIAAVPGKCIVVYLENGGNFSLIAPDPPREFVAYNPKTGDAIKSGSLVPENRQLEFPFGDPLVLVFQ